MLVLTDHQTIAGYFGIQLVKNQEYYVVYFFLFILDAMLSATAY